MPRRITPTPDTCPRCNAVSVCSSHEQFATKDRPTAAALLAVVAEDRDAILHRMISNTAPEYGHREPRSAARRITDNLRRAGRRHGLPNGDNR